MLIAATPVLVLGLGAALPPLLDPPHALSASAAVSGNASSAPRRCILTTTPLIVGLADISWSRRPVTRRRAVRRSDRRLGGRAPSASRTGTGRCRAGAPRR